MTKLKDFKSQSGVFPRGTVFRCPSYRGSDKYVHIMIVEIIGDTRFNHGLIYTSGYDAGYPFVHFPVESSLPGTRMLSAKWLQENWNKYIPDDKPYEEIEIVGRYSSEMKLGCFEPDFG